MESKEKSVSDHTSDGLAVVAHHEAGHCFVAYKLRMPLRGHSTITIEPSDDYSGAFIYTNILRNEHLDWDNSDRSRLKMERAAEVCLSGIEAQRIYDPTSINSGTGFGDWDGGHDYHEAIKLIDYFVSGPKELEAYLELLRIRAESMLQNECNWNCVSALAAALLEKRTLAGKEAIKIIQSTIMDLVAKRSILMPA